ncbi:MAG TPA: hypothetical protein VMU04_16690 [Candidatus Acidoferrum sp.]|nr:hypothetical protein [Candidatus Acidoferrum sp.]
MKTLACLFSAFVAGSLALAVTGCHKETASQQPQTLDGSVVQLRAALAKTTPQIQSKLYDGVVYNIRYEKYVDALAALDSIASDPSLTEPQKMAVSNTLSLLTAKVKEAPPAAK